MEEIKFTSLNELYERVLPALSSRKEEIKRMKVTYVKEEDIWNYLKETKWKNSGNLTLIDMVNDILASIKADLTTYQNAISEAENVALRQTLAQIRNNDESFQYDLFKVAQVKGYYIPAEKAPQTEINKVKEEISNS